jgi:plastocyanin
VRIAAAAAFAALVVLAPAEARTSKSFPTRVQVTAKEFWYALSSRSVKPGQAVIEFVNFGQDPHDMRVQKIGTTKVYSVPTVQPGNHYDLSIKLLPGRYLLWCSIANHRQLGMVATLVVKPGTA